MDEEHLRHECLQKSEIPKREELLYELNYMQVLVSIRLDTWFCNNFWGESVQLLINSIFLRKMAEFGAFFKEYFSYWIYLISSRQILNLDTEQVYKKWTLKRKTSYVEYIRVL